MTVRYVVECRRGGALDQETGKPHYHLTRTLAGALWRVWRLSQMHPLALIEVHCVAQDETIMRFQSAGAFSDHGIALLRGGNS